MQLEKHTSTYLYVALYSILTIVIWQVPNGHFILFPFTILGTWFHEISHGLFSVILGGDFLRLEIFQDGSGIAVHSGDLFFGVIGDAIVAGAGPMGPTIFGTVLIRSSFSEKSSKYILTALALFQIISTIIWIRSVFGFIIILTFGLALLYISLKSSFQVIRNVVVFLGIQAFLSLYLSIGYLFSYSGVIEGKTYISDTGIIQNSLFLPYWVWATIILILSLTLFITSLKNAYK